MLNVIAVYQTVAFSVVPSSHAECKTATPAMWVDTTPPCLHAPPCLQACHGIGRNAFFTHHLAVHHLETIGISPSEV